MNNDNSSDESCNSSVSDKNYSAFESLCRVSVIKIDNKSSLLIDNESGTFTVKHDQQMFVITPSDEDGLRINNDFKLHNDIGTLAYFPLEFSRTFPLEGKYVEYTGNNRMLRSSGRTNNIIYVPEVRLCSSLNVNTCGLIYSDINANNVYTMDNLMYDFRNINNKQLLANLSTEDLYGSDGSETSEITNVTDNRYYVTIVNKGYIKINSKESFNIGDILIPDSIEKYKKCVDMHELHDFTIVRVPIAKVVSKQDNTYVIEVL